MDEREFKARTKAYALRVIRLVEALPSGVTPQTLGRQLLRSGTSVAANYRAACRARSKADMIAKLKVVEEEADESLFWMELLVESRLVPNERLCDLRQEGDEILSMTVASIKTLRRQK